MAIEKMEIHEVCRFQHLRMRTARMKSDKETEDEGKKKRVIMEKSTAGTK